MTTFCAEKKAIMSLNLENFIAETTVPPPGISNLLAAEGPTLGRGYNFKSGWLVSILGHIHACPTRFLVQKTSVISKKRLPNKKLSSEGKLVVLTHSVQCCPVLFLPSRLACVSLFPWVVPRFSFIIIPLGTNGGRVEFIEDKTTTRWAACRARSAGTWEEDQASALSRKRCARSHNSQTCTGVLLA